MYLCQKFILQFVYDSLINKVFPVPYHPSDDPPSSSSFSFSSDGALCPHIFLSSLSRDWRSDLSCLRAKTLESWIVVKLLSIVSRLSELLRPVRDQLDLILGCKHRWAVLDNLIFLLLTVGSGPMGRLVASRVR